MSEFIYKLGVGKDVLNNREKKERIDISIMPHLREKAMASHSSTLAWKIPWTEEPGGLQSMGSLGVGLHFHFSLSCIGEGNGNPLLYSCLENPRDGGGCWPAVYGVAQSSTRLKWLSNSNILLIFFSIIDYHQLLNISPCALQVLIFNILFNLLYSSI